MNASVEQIYAFLAADETAAEFLARTYVAPLRTGVPLIDNRTSLRPTSVVEISGNSRSGKTEVLLNVCFHFNY